MDCKCETCIRENCQERTKQDDSSIVTCCSDYLERKITNADRIRAMSDEELAEFLGEYRFCDICDEGCEACTYHGDCNKRLLDWLKQPAEGDVNNG